MTVSAIAEGYNSVTAFFHVRDADRLIAFLRVAFGAEETQRTLDAGRVVHAEVSIGDSRVMIGEPWGGGSSLGVFSTHTSMWKTSM